MDIFRILSRGAALKKSKDVTTDYALPSERKVKPQTKAHREETLRQQVDKEIDFFHTKKKNSSNVPAVEEASSTNTVLDNTESTNEPIEEIPLKIGNKEDAEKWRKANMSKVSGDDIPHPIGSFEDMISRFNFDKKILSNLIDNEFVDPTPIQCESIPITLNDNDLIACAPTGSGKTLAFLIPMVHQLLTSRPKGKNYGIRGLIISPTNELALQISQQLETITRGKKLNTTILSKLIASKLKNDIIKGDKYEILVTTPLRLIDVVKLGKLDLSKVEHLVIDEADKLFDQGFVEQTDDILSNCSNKLLRKSMFSATIPSGVEAMGNSIMRDPIRVIIGHKEAASSTIDQKLVFTGNEEGKLLAIRQMLQQGEFKPPVIIFLQSIHRAKALFHELLYDRLNVDVIHAERTPKQRDEVIKKFKNGDIWVLVTTDVISRGVDFKGVNLVINYDVPLNAQAYVHRIGRTGRGGKTGRAVTFYTKEDSQAIIPIRNVMKQSGCSQGYSEWMEGISKLSKNEKKYIRTHEKRRGEISTVPQVFKDKRNKRKLMIEESKRKKQQTEQIATSK
ncbi:RNA-dependent ATPase rok1 [Scheffersomyces spartinae]|uniref:RNA helicase n=1 Tax=Scheffersomyces spartinae TaxID=45513 RepID=A0A9P7VDM9_9ASCO|nr:RNA-dependent ATPase rok1 [Scheffersomyces spartinae]KAG7195890.1 RNA-dependent ATPase rok1 [Scheffersomyces spartinae]